MNHIKLLNYFFSVADKEDKFGFIKKGNEKVVAARLSDAEYFWKKNKSQSMLKRVSKLEKVNYFNGLGNYLDKTKRIKNLSSINCFSNEEDKWRNSKMNFENKYKLNINLEGKFVTERGRINCSLREDGGFYRWLGVQFVVKEK